MLKKPLDVLTASVQVKQPADTISNEGTGAGTRTWQREAWDYYDLVGEFHYSGNFVGNCLSRIRLTVAVPDDDGVPGPAFNEDGVALHPDAEEAAAKVKELRSSLAGQSQVMRALGLNVFVAGECYLHGTAATDDTAIDWEVLSVDELRPLRSGGAAGGKQLYERIEEPSVTSKKIPPEDAVLRIWQPHPRWSLLADSSARAVRDILEEIVLLTREVRGQALSRIAAAGVFVVPTEIDYPDDENASEESDEGDPFTRDLIRTMATAISDKASAAAVVPFVLRAGYEYCDRIRHIEFTRPKDIESVQKRQEAVQRFAQGVDLPVEVVTGHAQTTFSNAWQIDESLFKAHIEPKVQTLVDALTVGYLRVLMPTTPLIVHYDASELVIHPDRSAVARDAYDRIELSGGSYRDALGFADSDAPDEQEIAQRLEWARLLKTPEAGPVGSGSTPAASPPGAGPVTRHNAVAAAAAEVSVMRAVERAGARLRGRTNGNGLAALLQGVPNVEVAATLGPEAVRRLFHDESELFKGEFSALRMFLMQHTPGDADAWVRWAEDEARCRLYTPHALRSAAARAT